MRIDTATSDDAAGIAGVHVRSWQQGYAQLLPADYLAAMSVAERAQRWRDILARGDSQTLVARGADGRVLGFVSLGPCRDEGADASQGEIWALYADPSAWRQGVGRALLAAALQSLQAAGRPRISLWVLAGNARGLAFYAAQGFAPVAGSAKRFELGGRALEELLMRLAPSA